jgi:sugar/nucleoside kinase (ribokinase family)
MSAVSIICQGPTGVGYFCDVTDLPTQDRGVVASRHGALLVCDAAIVAYICARRLTGRVHLVTNNLGSVVCESQLIREKLENGVTIHPDPSPFRGAPIDMVFVDRRRGTRRFVTTNYYPSSSHILTATRDLYASLPRERRTVLYVDIEVASESGKAALDASPFLTTSDGTVWNLGQVAQLSDVEDWLSGTVLPEKAIVQVSLGNSKVTASELRSAYQRISSAPNQTLVVTLGSTGAAWADDRNTEVIAVDPVSDAFTLGAGAVLAGSLVAALAVEESPNVGVAVSDAVGAATRYVRDATVDGDMQGLAFW